MLQVARGCWPRFSVVRHFAALLSVLVPVVSTVTSLHAQAPSVPVNVEIRHAGSPVAGVAIVVGTARHISDANGVAAITLAPGPVRLAVEKAGFEPQSIDVVIGTTRDQRITVELVPALEVEEEVTVIASTRTGRRIEDQPMRVEVLGREEIEEKMLMTPGDIVMMLNEMGGLRVQATSPSLGAASVRIQGMRGRYTRLLSDGLPLFGEQPGGLGLLQIPPMDLAQVEVIKGVASALYGAGAMGGVVNLLSRRPGAERQAELLLNQSTRGATDAVTWFETPINDRWGMTLLGSVHAQNEADVDEDDWSDLPWYRRGVVRPRVFWDGGNGRTFFATTGVTWENRRGGTEPGATLPATGAPYRESLETRRFDVGAMGQTILAQTYVVTARGAFMRQGHDHLFGEVQERDRHTSAFGEVAVRGQSGRHTWVAGVAVEHDRYRPEDVPRFAYTYTTPGVFAQDDVDVRPWLTISGSGRLDFQSEYGAFFSPRLSALVRGHGWTSRVSAGLGFFAPTPLTEETEAAGLTNLSVPVPLSAERGRSASWDIGRSDGPLTYSATLFASRVADPAVVDRDGVYALGNLEAPTTNAGVELLGTLRKAPVVVTATYTYVRSREVHAGTRLDVPYTPRHSAGIVAMVEKEETGRLGLEVYVTGQQRLEANPYRATSRPYVIVGLLAERRIGRVRLFINGENLTGVRQSRWDPLLRPTAGADGRWTVDAWAPLEGRVINGGIRIR